MLLYHGSNLIVQKPSLLESKRALDFGKAFYLTSDLEQAYALKTIKAISAIDFKEAISL